MHFPQATRVAFRAALAGGIAAALIAGCSSGSTLGGAVTPNVDPAATQVPRATPSAGASGAPSANPSGSPAAGPSASPRASTAPTSAPTTKPTNAPANGGSSPEDFVFNSGVAECSPRSVNPGTTAIGLSATGNVENNQFAASADSGYFQMTFKNATPEPVPSVTLSPEVDPTPQSYVPTYVYVGYYTAKNTNGSENTKGCTYLITTVNGAPLTGFSNQNAISANFVPTSDTTTADLTATGKVTSYSVNLNSGGGNGSFALDNGMTGTVSLSKRYTYQFPVYAQTELLSRMKSLKGLRAH